MPEFKYPNKVVLSIVKQPRYALLILGVFELCGQLNYVARNIDVETGGIESIVCRTCQYIDDNFKLLVVEAPGA